MNNWVDAWWFGSKVIFFFDRNTPVLIWNYCTIFTWSHPPSVNNKTMNLCFPLFIQFNIKKFPWYGCINRQNFKHHGFCPLGMRVVLQLPHPQCNCLPKEAAIFVDLYTMPCFSFTMPPGPLIQTYPQMENPLPDNLICSQTSVNFTKIPLKI